MQCLLWKAMPKNFSNNILHWVEQLKDNGEKEIRKEKKEIRRLQTLCLSRAVQIQACCSPEMIQNHKWTLLQEMVLLVALFVCLTLKTWIWGVNGHFGVVLCAGRAKPCPTVSWAVWVSTGGVCLSWGLFFEGLRSGLNVIYDSAQKSVERKVTSL